MEYTLLSSLFYQDKTKYEQTYQNRINSESTYKLGFTINEFPAFVMITPEILENIQKIFELNSKLNILESKLPILAIEQYRKKCLVDEIKKTNDIESVYSTKKEIKRILNSPSTTKKNRFFGLVIKYEKIIKGEKIALKTCSDIRSLYDEFALNDVLADNPNNMPYGELFRTKPVFVGGSSGKIIHEGIYPENKIIEVLSSSLNFLNDESYNFFIRVAVFHYMFGYIHPFYDGNGRMSRFISSYLLSQKLNKFVSLRLSYTIKEKQSSYYKMFKVTNNENNKGDLTYFVTRFLELIIESIEDLISALDFKSSQLKHYAVICNKLSKIDKKLPDLTYVLIQNELFDDDPLDLESLKLIFSSKIGDSKLRNLLKHLEKKDILIVDKTHRKYTYRINLHKLENI